MDTKLKSFNKKKVLGIIAYIVCVLTFLATIVMAGMTIKVADNMDYSGGVDSLILYDNYKESIVFQQEFESMAGEIIQNLDEYKSEEYIKSGKSISKGELENSIASLYAGHSEEYGDDYGDRYYEDKFIREAFEKDYADDISEVKRQMIMDDLRNFQDNTRRFSETEGFTYYGTDGTYTITNLKNITSKSAIDTKIFTGQPASFIYKDDKLAKSPASVDNKDGGMRDYDKMLEDIMDSEYNPNLKVYFAFDSNYLDAKEAAFESAKGELFKWIPIGVASALLSLATLIYLLVTTGRKDEEGNRTDYKFDRIFTEIQIGAIAFLLLGGGYGFMTSLYQGINYGIPYSGDVYSGGTTLAVSILLAGSIGLASAAIGLAFILSCVRNIKAGRFFKNSLICRFVMAVVNGIKDIYHGGSIMVKVVMVALAISLVSASVIGAPIVMILVIIIAPGWIKKYEGIKKGVGEVKNGNLNYKIPVKGDGELDQLAKGINEISEASSVAIQSELKNQRLKTDLISNVSHDLKTPLTSIITYIDLLKKEGLTCEEAPKYLDILDQKSQRLKKLTEDLFDAAKASSGAIPVRFETVEMMSLINQGLGEMSDRIEASGLEFKVSAEKEKYYARADGQLLWRVLENLLGNVLKYAQEGSRVYIDLREQGGTNGNKAMIILEVKNISRVELNIEAEELMERFKRGDESRTTEGSGLGLAIAKDLVRLQNGWFEIKIDGDLFKAIVMLEADTKNEEPVKK